MAAVEHDLARAETALAKAAADSIALQCDVTCESEVAAAVVTTVERLGGLDTLPAAPTRRRFSTG